ncbi:heme exporter protein CcmD [Moraxella haemolytica]|uniref:heme exporter protein CcmD n=1 Tax=Moraxella TaxID=475 RepID=UPI00254278E2|nr:heme exporter protein CcmD [Moraxella sp. ZY171148]WII95525.1 heme exporter protein CcmD [Moraxella sp. ZY171148]
MTPYFSTFSDLIDMQGHGAFVWLCYGITFLSLVALIIYVISERKNTLIRLKRQSGSHQKNDRLTNKQRKALGNQHASQS